MQHFNIYITSQLSGVASATIRMWEKRYQAIHPKRSSNGHRLYSETDIQKISLLFELTKQGHSIGKIASLPIEELKNILKKPLPNQQKSHHKEKLAKGLQNILMALQAYKLEIITHELEKARCELSAKDFAIEVMLPLIQQIEMKVYNHELTIAQEHTLSALIIFQAGQYINSNYTEISDSQKLMVIAGLDGELHDIGILISCLLCVHYHIKFIFLGTNLSADTLSEAINALKATHLILGVATGYEQRAKVSLDIFLKEIQNKVFFNPVIVVGGSSKLHQSSFLKNSNILFLQNLERLDSYLSEIKN